MEARAVGPLCEVEVIGLLFASIFLNIFGGKPTRDAHRRALYPQTFMFCALSGTSPARPVVSVKSGHVFEASAIEKYISSTGKCPVTGQPLQAADLLPLKTTSAKSRHLAAMSIPGMMTLFQDEWDGLILETYALKQQVCYHDDQPELCLLTPCPCSFCHLGGYYAPGAWPRALPA